MGNVPHRTPAEQGVPQILFTPEEVGAMFGRTGGTIRGLAHAGRFPYRLEWFFPGPGKRSQRMVFSMREIQAALDYFAPPVERVHALAAERAATRPCPTSDGAGA